MVFATQGRKDADSVLLMKTVTYYKVTHTMHPMYGTYTANVDGTGYTIKAQVRPALQGDLLVKQGKIKQGDNVGVLRYQYTQDTSGTTITPTITPVEDDELMYNTKRYRVSELTPIYDQEGTIMWFDCALILMDDTGV